MRAVRCHELTGPEALRVDEIEAPVPGAGELLIDVAAAGVNFPDVLITQGKYQLKPPTPFIPGGEVSGTVKGIGSGVAGFALGDRVAATMVFGAFAEQVVVRASATAKLPIDVSFETGAAVLLTYATSMHALVDRAKLLAGETLLVLGAAGGVGIAAVELGKALGARVIAAASNEEKLAFCRAHGADETIDYVKEDLKARAKALAPNGIDVIYDPVGGELSEAALRAIAWEGRHLVVGFAAGSIPKIPANLLLLKGCQLIGVFWGSFVEREPVRNAANVTRVLSMVASGALKPHVERVVSFDRAAEALGRLAERRVLGKVVLVPRACGAGGNPAE